MELQPLKIRFYPKKKWGTSERYTLYMRITLAGKRTDICLHYDLLRESWDDNEQELRAKHIDKGYILNLTNQYRHKALTVYQQLIQHGISCDVNTIRQKLTGDSNSENSETPTLFKLFNRIMERKKALAGKNNTKATIQKYRRCKVHLEIFIKELYKIDDIGFGKINLQFIEDFELYLKTQAKLYAYIDPSVDRFEDLEEEQQDEFKKGMTSFVRLYAFLSQIMPFQDVDLEKLYAFGRFLLSKLPKSDYTERLKLDNEVALEYYRLQKVAEGDLVLQVQGEATLSPTTEAGIPRQKDEKDKLSTIINLLNDRFGTDFTEADRLYFEQLEQALFENDDLKLRAQSNPIENFKYAFDEVFIQTLIDRMDSNQDIFDKIMENSDFKNDVKEWLTKKIYQRFNEKQANS